MTTDLDQKVIDLAGLALSLGRINRTACWHPEGDQRESVADHTVMLGWIAPALADLLYRDMLSPPLVATLALVHDMVEVYAGDTPTLRITARKLVAKEAREMLAKDRLTGEFVESLPWIPAMIDLYERQYIPEARFVRAVDKMLPKLVHLLDGAKGLIEEKMTVAELDEVFTKQAADIQLYASEFPELLALRSRLVIRVTELLRSLTEFDGSTVHELIDSDTDIN